VDNVPYQSKDFLVVSAQGLKNGDPILLAGYPGRTSRYKLPEEIRFARDVSYPARVAESRADIATIDAATAGNPELQVRYASVVKGIQNGLKKTQGLLDGFMRKDLAAIKDTQDAEFRSWIAQNKRDDAFIKELENVIAADMRLSEREFGWSVATNSDLLRIARTLYRLALENEKPDAERKAGYQQRDRSTIAGRLSRLQQSFAPKSIRPASGRSEALCGTRRCQPPCRSG
jgi:hypothetical protein